MATVTKTKVREHVRTIRREAGWINSALDAYGLDRMLSDPRLRFVLAETLNVIDGTTSLLREALTEEGD